MYPRILVPIDGSPTSNAGLDEAVKLARLAGSRLRLLHVVDEMPFMMGADGGGTLSADVFDSLKQAGEGILSAAKKRVEASDVPVDCRLFDSLDGRLCNRVAEQANEWNASLIVLGTHGRKGIGRLLLGSDAEQILRTTSVPVLLIRGPDAVKAAP